MRSTPVATDTFAAFHGLLMGELLGVLPMLATVTFELAAKDWL